jgi:hypothetical protein
VCFAVTFVLGALEAGALVGVEAVVLPLGVVLALAFVFLVLGSRAAFVLTAVGVAAAGYAAESAGAAVVIVSSVLVFLDRVIFVFADVPDDAVVSVAVVAGAAMVAVFDFVLDLDLVLAPAAAVSVAAVPSADIVVATGVFFFFEPDFLVVVFLAVVPVIVVD